MNTNQERRQFLQRIGRLGMAAVTIPAALQALGLIDREACAALGDLKEVRDYERLPGTNTIQCFVCPLNCVLPAGKTCFCMTRKNHNGTLYSHAFNNPAILRLDTIEKLPLNHFLPQHQTLSLATGGCNLRCLYCQNWQQSQSKPENLRTLYFPREKALQAVKGKHIPIIAYTYTEPVSFLEYAMSIAAYTRPRGIRNVAASSVFINERPLREFCAHLDGLAVALKGFSNRFYVKVCGQPLKPVLKSIEVIADTNVWFELVTLIVPTYNDNPRELKAMMKWIRRHVGTKVPLHLGRFVPKYKLSHLPQAPLQTLEDARKMALDEGLKYVYLFNVAPHEGNNTYCHACHRLLIERLGFKVLTNHIRRGRCRFCGAKIPGVWH